MQTLSQRRFFLALGLVFTLGLLTAACEPPPHFFTTSNVNGPLMSVFGVQDPFQRFIAPGTLNIGSKKPSEDIRFYTNIGGADRVFSIWDPQNLEYVSVAEHPRRTERLMRDNYLEVRPQPNRQLQPNWIDPDTQFPTLSIPLNRVMNQSLGVGTIYTIKIYTTAPDGTPAFQVVDPDDTWVSSSDNRNYYVRAGANGDATPPLLTDIVIDQIGGGATLTFSEELGVLAAGYLPQFGDTIDYDLFVAVYNNADENSFNRLDGSASYSLSVPSQFPLQAGVTYHFLLLQQVSDMVLMLDTPLLGVLSGTQDLSGNYVDCGPDVPVVDFCEIGGQEPCDILACSWTFTKPAE